MSDALLHELAAEIRMLRKELRAMRADVRRVLSEHEGKSALLDWWRRESRGCRWSADGLIALAAEDAELSRVLPLLTNMDSEFASIALGKRLARWPEVVRVRREANTAVYGLAGDQS